MNRKNKTVLASLLFATAIAGCSGPIAEPKREGYGADYLRMPNGTTIVDACDAQGNSGSDGIADVVLIGELNMHRGPYQYQLREPGCKAARDAIKTIEMAPEIQQQATRLLQSYDELRYLTDHVVWEDQVSRK